MSEAREARSPFGGMARNVLEMPTSKLISMYQHKCGVDVSDSFRKLDHLVLYECPKTGYRFWRPEEVAGDEDFYRKLSTAWPEYYRTERWEYEHARRVISAQSRVLEVGCGRGWFLRSLEGRITTAKGLEYNRQAIADKVTSFPMESLSINEFSNAYPDSFDVVCIFHVLEHVVDPAIFLKDCLRSLRRGGLLVVSTPNHASSIFRNREDAFDLPPHHMGHFHRDTYVRIARELNLQVSMAIEQPKHWQGSASAASAVDGRRSPARILHRARGHLVSAYYLLKREPGDIILVIFRK